MNAIFTSACYILLAAGGVLIGSSAFAQNPPRDRTTQKPYKNEKGQFCFFSPSLNSYQCTDKNSKKLPLPIVIAGGGSGKSDHNILNRENAVEKMKEKNFDQAKKIEKIDIINIDN